jgi:alpha/beta superfamily hydrolase
VSLVGRELVGTSDADHGTGVGEPRDVLAVDFGVEIRPLVSKQVYF